MRKLLLGLIFLGSGAALSAQSATTQVETVSDPAAIDKTSQTEDVRFHTEAYDRMTVPVRLSGTGPYRFLVDTGADRTAISRQLAAKLRLVAGDDADVHSIAGVTSVSTATVPELQLTRKAVKIRDAPLLETANMGADGILGVDSLRAQRVMFDFVGETMSIVPSVSPDFADEPGTIVIEARRRNGRLIVTDAEANGRHVTIVLDTGSQISIGNEALKRALTSRQVIDPVQQVELVSVTGEKLAGQYMFIRNLEMGGIGLKNLAVVFADAHTFKQLNLDRKPALLLGMNALRAFKKVSIDFANSKFRVVVPEQSAIDVRMASRL
jgi:predicted aspartyl protease